MIISKVERVWTLIIAVLMLCAACAYTITVSDVISEHLTVFDICWIYSPAVTLFVYGVILIICYRQRGILVSSKFISSYQGSKYPWL